MKNHWLKEKSKGFVGGFDEAARKAKVAYDTFVTSSSHTLEMNDATITSQPGSFASGSATSPCGSSSFGSFSTGITSTITAGSSTSYSRASGSSALCGSYQVTPINPTPFRIYDTKVKLPEGSSSDAHDNGDMWVQDGVVYVHSNGITKNI